MDIRIFEFVAKAQFLWFLQIVDLAAKTEMPEEDLRLDFISLKYHIVGDENPRNRIIKSANQLCRILEREKIYSCSSSLIYVVNTLLHKLMQPRYNQITISQ